MNDLSYLLVAATAAALPDDQELQHLLAYSSILHSPEYQRLESSADYQKAFCASCGREQLRATSMEQLKRLETSLRFIRPFLDALMQALAKGRIPQAVRQANPDFYDAASLEDLTHQLEQAKPGDEVFTNLAPSDGMALFLPATVRSLKEKFDLLSDTCRSAGELKIELLRLFPQQNYCIAKGEWHNLQSAYQQKYRALEQTVQDRHDERSASRIAHVLMVLPFLLLPSCILSLTVHWTTECAVFSIIGMATVSVAVSVMMKKKGAALG